MTGDQLVPPHQLVPGSPSRRLAGLARRGQPPDWPVRPVRPPGRPPGTRLERNRGNRFALAGTAGKHIGVPPPGPSVMGDHWLGPPSPRWYDDGGDGKRGKFDPIGAPVELGTRR